MLNEDFIPQKWFNSIFSELENYELVQNSVEWGFAQNECTLKKRDGLFTDQNVWWIYNRQMDAAFAGKIVFWWLAFIRDQSGNVYRFEKISWSYAFSKVFDNSGPSVFMFDTDMYGNIVKQKAIVLPYTSLFINNWTADKVLSTNDDGSGNVVLTVNEAATFAAWSVGQYIYFTNAASAAAKYQIRQIVQFIDGKTVYLGEAFYADPSTRWIAEPGETYETIANVIVFNNLRDTNGLVLCIDTTDNSTTYRNLSGNDIELFEWRFRQISGYGTSVGGSLATGEYEILDPATVRGDSVNARWFKMNSLILAKNYLIVNLENSVSVLWNIWVDTNNIAIYNLTSVANWESSFWVDSIFYKWWLYFVGKDRLYEWWDIIPTSTNIIELQVKNQWIIIEHYLKQMNYSDYVRCYDYWKWMIIQFTDWTDTRMLVYDAIYEWRLPWTFKNNAIYDKFEMFYGDMLICVGDKVCLKQWNIDITENISCKCVITGSKQIKNSIFSVKKIKLALWRFNNLVHNFKIRIDLGEAVFESKIEKDSMWVSYLTRQNLSANGSSLGSIPIGFNLLGWWNGSWWSNMISMFIARMWLIGIPVGKKCTYYKITLENLDNYDLNIQGITVLTEAGNPYVTPLQNVF